MTVYYVSGCIDNGSEVETCDDSEATFWTLYERDAEGLSQGIIDCKFREDAEAAMRVYQEHDALQQQVKKLAAEGFNLIKFIVDKCYVIAPGRDEALADADAPADDFIPPTPSFDAIKRQWMAEGAKDVFMLITNRESEFRQSSIEEVRACAFIAENHAKKLLQPEG